MASLLSSLVRSARPRQSLKNLSLAAPLIFSGYLFVFEKTIITIYSMVTFSLLTSAVYLFNDLADLPSDRMHPYKKRRPLASGELPIPIAFFVAVFVAFLALYLALANNIFFFLTCLIYLIIQFFYTFLLKKIVLIDVLTIASGFVLRVYAGAFALNVHMSVWFLLCVISLSLFLAVGKRRAELTVLTKTLAAKHRQTLIQYSPETLNNYLAMFSTSSFISYALFTFFEPPPLAFFKFPWLSVLLDQLPPTITGTNKWLMVTIPLVIFGIMRYTKIIYEGEKAEAPERVLLSDKQLLGSVIIWGLLVITIIYGLG
ncbi:UbiA prenyltransferase family protein [Patescibacteria group bacterium]